MASPVDLHCRASVLNKNLYRAILPRHFVVFGHRNQPEVPVQKVWSRARRKPLGSVSFMQHFFQWDARPAEDSGQIAEGGGNSLPCLVCAFEIFGSGLGPPSARSAIYLGFFPADHVIHARMRNPWKNRQKRECGCRSYPAPWQSRDQPTCRERRKGYKSDTVARVVVAERPELRDVNGRSTGRVHTHDVKERREQKEKHRNASLGPVSASCP